MAQETESAQLHDLRRPRHWPKVGSLAGAARRFGSIMPAPAPPGALEGRLGGGCSSAAATTIQSTATGEEAIAAAGAPWLSWPTRAATGRPGCPPDGPGAADDHRALLDLVMPVLGGLRRTHPGISSSSTPQCLLPLTRRDADIALRPAAARPQGGRAPARRGRTSSTPAHTSRAAVRSPRWIGSPRTTAWRIWARRAGSLPMSPPERVVHRASSLTAVRVGTGGHRPGPLPCFWAIRSRRWCAFCRPEPEMESTLVAADPPRPARHLRVPAVLDLLGRALRPCAAAARRPLPPPCDPVRSAAGAAESRPPRRSAVRSRQRGSS